jgi:two-component system, OmpR family, sensor histidine kinase CreC
MLLRLSLRIFLVYFLLVGVGLFMYFSNAANQLRPMLRQSAENALVDTANLLAELVARDIVNNQLDTEKFAEAITQYQHRQLKASIWDIKKLSPELSVYITDLNGIVIFHSDENEIGKDYSRWMDVNRTLKGLYGARTTRIDPEDELTSVMYVAAPIYNAGDLQGVLTVIQPNESSLPFLTFARQQLITQGSLILLLALIVGALMTYWLTHSVRKLSDYVQKVRRGERVEPPKLYESELRDLANATESMRKELEGKAYIENYVHTLTHEMKSPLAAIRGAAELLEEGNMEVAAQAKFLRNIRQSAYRMQSLIDRLLALAAIENTRTLTQRDTIALKKLVEAELDTKQNRFQQKHIAVDVSENKNETIIGDSFLLQQAICNLLDNAIDFAAPDSQLSIVIEHTPDHCDLFIRNQGEWIPEYALSKIFDRFYSLARSDGSGKSSGIGLSFVREIAQLHQGSISLSNIGNSEQQIVEARLRIATHIK